MGSKVFRQAEIRRIVEAEPIKTQGDLISVLLRSGIKATQSTLSKDLKELGLARIPTEDGGFRYQRSGDHTGSLQNRKLLERELSDFLVNYDDAGNLLVLRTTPGNAMSVAAALDDMKWQEIIGTIAGDDTILVISKSPAQIEIVKERIRQMMGK